MTTPHIFTLKYKLSKRHLISAMIAENVEEVLTARYPSLEFEFAPEDDTLQALFVLTVKSEKKLTQKTIDEMLFFVAGAIAVAQKLIR